jgi:lipopolysaccharide biosynthesis glycosyltransferase
MRALTFALDDAYAAPFKVLWHSLMATDSIPWGTPIFLLHGGDRLSAGVRRDLASYIGGYGRSMQFIDANHLLPRDLPIQWHNHATEAAFIRLFLGSALPTTITSAVYLDVDAVALHSLRELFELPLTAPIAAADHLAPAVALRLWGDRGGSTSNPACS